MFYAFVGNPTSCLAGCSPNNQNVSPNGSPGVDAMISVIAHGTITDNYREREGVGDGERSSSQFPTSPRFPVIIELTEAVTDPVSDVDTLRAWQDAQGAENADKCAYVYGNMTSENGYKYNIVQGSRKYLIQQNWSPAAPQGCHTSVSI